MSIKDLAVEYNNLLKKHNIDKPGVKKFSSLVVGEKRLAQLEEEIKKNQSTKVLPAKVLPTISPALKAGTTTEKFRPAVEGQRMKYKLFKINPEITRKKFIEACVAIGIKKSTAGQQWGFTMEELEKKFGGSL